MHLKEYRICMPLSVEEYEIGQLYMIAKHCHEQSSKGDGVEVVKNEPCEDPKHGKGNFTEKRIHLLSRLPSWIQSMIPSIFYITEKAWNYYPYTITVFFHSKDLTKFKSTKTGRGPLEKGWRDSVKPIMCSYKAVKVKFEVWGLQTKVEEFTHRSVREVLLLGHRQAFAWIDEWIDMTKEDVRAYENKTYAETNQKVLETS
ncbi:hypothetical protein KUTeg_003987 [Tegillarca granosa]|uniref:Phosphatidylinositol transfer protein N-terminal domain-containing protein n=1 Tax=Tegillarca granosa TaxID=220873 RepID=A0ABQ9FRV8_TEGGR|nr:hypothetical protein KUTeg_003987 [Tegillarca granosa]